jgi:hypothetical protein
MENLDNERVAPDDLSWLNRHGLDHDYAVSWCAQGQMSQWACGFLNLALRLLDLQGRNVISSGAAARGRGVLRVTAEAAVPDASTILRPAHFGKFP